MNFIQPTAAASVSKHSENGGWSIEDGKPPQIHPPSSTHPAPACASGDGGPAEKFQSVIERLSGFFSEAHLSASVNEAICEPPAASTPARQRPAFAPGTGVKITTAAPKRSFRPGAYSPEGEDEAAAELEIVAVPFISTGKAGSSQASDAERSPKSKVQRPKPDLGLWTLDFSPKFAPSGKRDEWQGTSGTKDGAASVSKQSENGGWSIEYGKPSQIHPPPSPHPVPAYAPGYGAAETLVAAKRSQDGPVAKLAVAAATVCASGYSAASGAEPPARSEPVVRSTNSPANPKTEPSGESDEWRLTNGMKEEARTQNPEPDWSAKCGVRNAEYPPDVRENSALRTPHSEFRSPVTPLTPATAALSRILSELDAGLAQTGINKTDLTAIKADGEIPQVSSDKWQVATACDKGQVTCDTETQIPSPVTRHLSPGPVTSIADSPQQTVSSPMSKVPSPTSRVHSLQSTVQSLKSDSGLETLDCGLLLTVDFYPPASGAASSAELPARSAPAGLEPLLSPGRKPAAGENLPTAPARSPRGVITPNPNPPPDISTPQGGHGWPELGEDGPAKDSMDLPETPQVTNDQWQMATAFDKGQVTCDTEPQIPSPVTRHLSVGPATCALPPVTIPPSPALDSTNFADGTVVAQQDAAMKKTAKKTICSEAKQNLPASVSDAGAAAPDTGEFLPVAAKRSAQVICDKGQGTCDTEPQIPSPVTRHLSPGPATCALPPVTIPADAARIISPGAGNLTHVPTAVPQYLERTRELVSLQVMRLQESGAEEMRVVIQPHSGLQLTLHLQQRGGGVEMQAVLDRGNFGWLNRHWPELQQQLELRGVRVAPLANAEPSFGGGSEGFRQPTTSHGQPAGDDPAPATIMPAVLIPGLPPAIATASASPISPRRLETWA